MDTANESGTANDVGGVGDTLRPTEALDSDDVRNVDGDEVVDPPEDWSAASKLAVGPDGIDISGGEETLDDKLAAERPDPAAAAVAGESAPVGEIQPRPADELDRVEADRPGADVGQVSGTPEDGDSFFPVVE